MNLSNVMPLHIGISMFLIFFSAALGIYAARALALCLRDIYEAATAPRTTAPNVDLTEHTWHNAAADPTATSGKVRRDVETLNHEGGA